MAGVALRVTITELCSYQRSCKASPCIPPLFEHEPGLAVIKFVLFVRFVRRRPRSPEAGGSSGDLRPDARLVTPSRMTGEDSCGH